MVYTTRVCASRSVKTREYYSLLSEVECELSFVVPSQNAKTTKESAEVEAGEETV